MSKRPEAQRRQLRRDAEQDKSYWANRAAQAPPGSQSRRTFDRAVDRAQRTIDRNQ